MFTFICSTRLSDSSHFPLGSNKILNSSSYVWSLTFLFPLPWPLFRNFVNGCRSLVTHVFSLCVCLHRNVHMCICMHTCRSQSLLLSTYCSGRAPLLKSRAYQFSCSTQHILGVPHHCLPGAGIKGELLCSPGIYVSVRDSNSGPYACPGNTLFTGPSLWPLNIVFW